MHIYLFISFNTDIHIQEKDVGTERYTFTHTHTCTPKRSSLRHTSLIRLRAHTHTRTHAHARTEMLVIETPVTSPVSCSDKRRDEGQSGQQRTPAIRSPHARFLDQSTTVPASPTPRILPTVVSDSPRQLSAGGVAQGYLHDSDGDDDEYDHVARRVRDSEFEGLLSESSWDANRYHNNQSADTCGVREGQSHRTEANHHHHRNGGSDKNHAGRAQAHDDQIAARDGHRNRMNESSFDKLMSSGLIREDLVELAKRAKLEELQDDDEEENEETALVSCMYMWYMYAIGGASGLL
jgi:hypothetical protein